MRLLLVPFVVVAAISCAPHGSPSHEGHGTKNAPDPIWELGTAVATSADLAVVRTHLPPGSAHAKASDATKNVQLFLDADLESLGLAMHGFERAIGEKCTYCHVEKKFDEDTDKKKIARQMIVMADDVNRTTFHGESEVTCWTCHRGDEEPEATPDDIKDRVAKAIPPAFKLSDADAAKPAKDVFKNLELLGNVPAGQIPFFMGFFSASLGEECDFCHVKDDAASDAKKEKREAREMMRMSLRASAAIDGTRGALTCWTCHRGHEHPERAPGGGSAHHHDD